MLGIRESERNKAERERYERAHPDVDEDYRECANCGLVMQHTEMGKLECWVCEKCGRVEDWKGEAA